MADLLLDGVPTLDLLEIIPSTSKVAQLTQRDQSSVSRIYRHTSERLGLAFGKQHNGRYQAGANQALLQNLRRASQLMRLEGTPSSPRWLNALSGGWPTAAASCNLPDALEAHGFEPVLLEALLLQRIVDAVVITATAAVQQRRPAIAAVPLNANAAVWLRADLASHPSLCSLMAHLTLATAPSPP